MQGSDRVLARRYSHAFFQSAAQDQEEDQAFKELSEAYRALSNRMAAFNPMTGAARQKSLLKKELGSKASARTLHFLELLVDKKRFNLLPTIVFDTGRILDEKRGVIRAQVKAAAALTDQEKEALSRRLRKFSGKDVALDVKTDPGLLGGVVVRMGDWVLDGSIRGKLRKMARQLVEA